MDNQEQSNEDLRGLPVPPAFRGASHEQNGRVTFGNTLSATASGETPRIPGYTHQTQVENDFMSDMLRGNWEETSLSRAFFSVDNIKSLQHSIRREVNARSGPKNYMIDEQSADELKIIMRGIYYQYARNLESDIKDQVKDLNTKIIDWSVPHILSAVDHYYYYINDISHLPVPMQQPQNISRAGTKSLPYNPYM